MIREQEGKGRGVWNETAKSSPKPTVKICFFIL